SVMRDPILQIFLELDPPIDVSKNSMNRNELTLLINRRGQLFKPPFPSIFIQPTLNDGLVIVKITAPFFLDDVTEIRVQMAVNVFGMLITQLYRASAKILLQGPIDKQHLRLWFDAAVVYDVP